MSLNLTTADAVLKEDYLPGIREQLNQDNFLTLVEKNTEDVTGRRAVIALHVGRNSGVGSRAELGTLPNAGNQAYQDEYIPVKYHYGRIEISGPSIKAMSKDSTSFTRAVRSEMDGSVNDLRRDLSRQCFGTTDGVLFACGASGPSNTVTVTPTIVQSRQVQVNDQIDIGTVANPTAVASNVTVTGVTFSGDLITAITVSGAAVTVTSADFVFKAGSGGTSPVKELTGLQTMVNNAGVLFNVDPATYPIWESYVDSNGGTLRSVAENTFAKAQQRTRIKGGGNLKQWITSDGVHRAYANLLTGLKRFTETVSLKGGYEGITASAGGTTTAPVTWDRDCPDNTAFGLDFDHLTEYQMSDWEWMDEDGAILHRVSGVDAYEATLFKYAELATDKRNAHAVVKDLTEA